MAGIYRLVVYIGEAEAVGHYTTLENAQAAGKAHAAAELRLGQAVYRLDPVTDWVQSGQRAWGCEAHVAGLPSHVYVYYTITAHDLDPVDLPREEEE